MDNPQYPNLATPVELMISFKPYYKWITLNTPCCEPRGKASSSFKPYYKWITLNTCR